MSKRYPKAKWVLPDVINPPTRKCFTILVPNDVQHLAAFRGALLNLASATNWADDEAHTAKDVANVWKGIVVDVTECGAGIPFACPYDFLPNNQGWSNVIDGNLSPNYRGVWVLDSGWQSTQCHVIDANQEIRSIRIELAFAFPFTVNTVVMQYNLQKGVFASGGSDNGILLYNSGSLVGSRLVAANTDPDGNGKILTYAGPTVTIDRVQLVVTCGKEDGSSNPGGGAVIPYTELDGFGVNPCS